METPSIDHTPRRDAPAQRQAAAGPLGLFDQILRNRNEGGSVSTEPTAVRPTKDRGAPAERSEEAPDKADQPEPVEATAEGAALAAPEAPQQQRPAPAAGAQTQPAATQQPLPAGQTAQAGQAEGAAAGQAEAAPKAPQAEKAAAAAAAPAAAKNRAETPGPGVQPQGGETLKTTPDLRDAVQSAAAALAGKPAAAATAAQAAGPKPTAGPNPTPAATKPSGQRNAAGPAANATPGPTGAERSGPASETFAALSLEAQQARPVDPAAGDLQNVNGLRPAAGLSGAPAGAADFAGLTRAPAEGRGTAVQQVAVQIKRAVAAGNDRIDIRLNPAELGRVQVRLEVADDGHVRALVTAERAETLDLMQRDPRGLEKALQEAGLKTDTGSLSFNLRDQGTDTAGSESGGTAPATENRAAQPDEAAPDNNTQLYWTGGDGRLDIRV